MFAYLQRCCTTVVEMCECVQCGSLLQCVDLQYVAECKQINIQHSTMPTTTTTANKWRKTLLRICMCVCHLPVKCIPCTKIAYSFRKYTAYLKSSKQPPIHSNIQNILSETLFVGNFPRNWHIGWILVTHFAFALNWHYPIDNNSEAQSICPKVFQWCILKTRSRYHISENVCVCVCVHSKGLLN